MTTVGTVWYANVPLAANTANGMMKIICLTAENEIISFLSCAFSHRNAIKIA